MKFYKMSVSQIINIITRFLHNHLNLMFVHITLSKVELDLVMFDVVNTNKCDFLI